MNMKLDADKQAALDLHNQGNPSFTPFCPATPIWLSHPARREASGGQRPDLVWNNDLASDAEAWALQMAVTGYFEHSPQRENGENLAYFEPAGNRIVITLQLRKLGSRRNSSTMARC